MNTERSLQTGQTAGKGLWEPEHGRLLPLLLLTLLSQCCFQRGPIL